MGKTVRIPACAAGKELLRFLTGTGHVVPAPCGGRGVCGKCRVRVLDGRFLTLSGQPLSPNGDGTIPACRALIGPGGGTVELPDSGGTGLTEFAGTRAAENGGEKSTAALAALDIGTTTLAAARIGSGGQVLSAVSRLNPQSPFGADVISRISACADTPEALPRMRELLRDEVNGMLRELFPGTEGRIDRLTVAGNATMLHLFLGVSPVSMGAYPFVPVFTDAREESGASLGLCAETVSLLPSVSAYVGADITAGACLCGLGASAGPALLLDLGTNGEMMLDTGDGRLLAAATAAGPALEGACISCGMGGVSGAVCRVTPGSLRGTLRYKTVNDAPARGLCGAGLVDLCARMLENGVLDESGALENGESYTLVGTHVTAAGENAGRTPVTLTQKDIRELQLAKSAVRAGIEALLDAGGFTPASFAAAGGRVFLSGGLGYYIDPESAAAVGLIPREFVGRIESAGNTALGGAALALTDPAAGEKMQTLARACREIPLDRSPVFREGFIEYMAFPEE